MALQAQGWFLQNPGEPLVKQDLTIPEPGPSEAVVQVLACGLCHTDLGFAGGSVRPNHPLPLVLGHEAVGTVVQAGEKGAHLLGKQVIVPAVLPCGNCEFCRAGRGNACLGQKMPGNDIHGGFASHVLVPAGPLVPLNPPGNLDIRAFSVVADAVSTAYQAVIRSGLKAGDAALLVGTGGVGGFVAQIAHALGAKVIACDVKEERLRLLSQYGVDRAVMVSGREVKDIRKEAGGITREWGISSLNTRIFECSGTPDGQNLAFAFLGRGSTLVQAGFTPAKVELRFSNLMAFDATVHGTWGCPPEAYPGVLDLIFTGKVVLDPFVEYTGMSRLNSLLDDMTHHRLTSRMILDPLQ